MASRPPVMAMRTPAAARYVPRSIASRLVVIVLVGSAQTDQKDRRGRCVLVDDLGYRGDAGARSALHPRGGHFQRSPSKPDRGAGLHARNHPAPGGGDHGTRRLVVRKLAGLSDLEVRRCGVSVLPRLEGVSG